MRARVKPHEPVAAAVALGLVFVGSVLLLAFLAAFGARVNITLGASVLSGIVFMASPVLRRQGLGGWNLSDCSLAAFVLFALLAIGLSLGRIGTLPFEYILHAMALIVLCPLAYFFGSTVASSSGAAGLKKVFYLALVIVTGFLVLIYALPDLVSDDEMVRGSYYQYSGDCLAVVGLMHLATREQKSAVWPVFLVIPVLVLIGSRASVAAYGVALMFSSLMPVVLATCLVGYLCWPLIESVILTITPDLLEVSRVVTSLMGALLEGREDASLLEREQFQRMAIESIKDHPLLGNFGYDYLWNGYVGGFSHSALDLWAQYGALTFLAFTAAVVAGPLMTLLWARRRAAGHLGTLHLVPLLVFLAMEFAFFRHPESVVLFFGMGALSGLSSRVVVWRPRPSRRRRVQAPDCRSAGGHEHPRHRIQPS
jgi:hypothetical protein